MEYINITKINDDYEGESLLIPVLPFCRTEQKLFELFISRIDFDLVKGDKSYLIDLPRKRIPIDYLSVQQALTFSASLVEKPITFLDLNRPKRPFITLLLFKEITYQKGDLEFIINAKMSKYMKELKPKYTGYNVETLLSFKSMYSSQLYKILRIHECQKKKQFHYEIDDLRKLLAIKEDIVPRFGAFNARILKPVFDEITSHSTHPIDFEYSTNAKFDHSITNRYVQYIYFRIRTKTKYDLTPIPKEINEEDE